MATEGVATRTLHVELISASGLKDTEFIGKSDPYAVLSIGKTERKSKVAKDQPSNPAWNETFTLPVLDTDADADLLVVIKNDDTLGRDEEMGRTSIPLSLIYGGSDSASIFPLELKGKPRGEIVLRLSFEGEGYGAATRADELTEQTQGLYVDDKPEHYDGEQEQLEGQHGGLKEKIAGLKEKRHRKHRGSGDEGGSSSSSSSDKEE